MKKRVLIINTGGTISCQKTTDGYQPVIGHVEKALTNIAALSDPAMPDYVIHEYNPLLDSSNMTVQDWNRIATDISQNYSKYDGFVVFHGTDTMAYTASALSFMLEHLNKPVILTGSQIPLSEIRNDAIDNVITSLWLCANQPIPEVCIYFNQQVLRGNRSQKVSTQGFNAFNSPNYPHLAKVGINIEIDKNLIQPAPTKPFKLQTITPHFIANFRLFPGFMTDVLDYLLNQPIRGLILETYGAGNAPNQDDKLLSRLKEACAQGIVIVNCSQCQEGRVEMTQYATGHALKEAGLISGLDMTPEAAHCKLLYLFSKPLSIETIKQKMEMNLCGELTV
jgi:L-asparaginase